MSRPNNIVSTKAVSPIKPSTRNTISSTLTTQYFFGGLYEVTGDTVKKYYAFAGMTIGMDDGSGMKYFLTDHLGSVVAITDAGGALISQQRYLPFGGVRTDVASPNAPATDLGYTGQRMFNI